MPKITALPNTTIPATDDLLPFVDVSGTPTTRKATVANLAASTAFTGQYLTPAAADADYAPLDATVWFGASDLVSTLGSPSASLLFRRPTWLLASANHAIGSSLRIPAGWSAVNVDVVVAPLDTDGTTYSLRLDGSSDAPGDTITTNLSSIGLGIVATTDGAGTAGAVKSVRLGTAVAVTPGEYLSFMVVRIAGDTSINVLGVLFTEAST